MTLLVLREFGGIYLGKREIKVNATLIARSGNNSIFLMGALVVNIRAFVLVGGSFWWDSRCRVRE